ncbi:MAG: aldehyde dehydrogenase family protein [Novosphingobium sp.]
MSLANDLSLLSSQARAFLDADHALFIDGREIGAESGKRLDVVDPSSGEVVATIADAGAADVDRAIAAARRAFTDSAWSKLRPFQREAIMLRLASLIEAETASLAQIETVNSGKLIGNTLLFDAELPVHTLRYFAGWATKLHGETMDLSVPYLPQLRFDGLTKRAPIGVVAAITPWNVPLCQAVWKLAPVLATGCTLVLKPAEQTSLTALRLAQLCAEAGLPDGVFNVVTGSGAGAGAALANHPGIDKISFTGSTAIGRQIAESAARRLGKYTLELGGKSPVVIAPDADLDQAIPGAAWAIFGNHGQNCCAGSRLIAHASIFEEVVAGVVKIGRELVMGPGLDPGSMLGPMVSQRHRDRVAGFVDRARADGAVVHGGETIAGAGAYISPAVITGVPIDHEAAQEEIFGPVQCAFAYHDDVEAIRLANATQYGLGASIWTSSITTQQRYFDAFDAGTVWVNTHNILDLALPFGGMRQSGVGHELGKEGLLAHTKLKASVILNQA